MSRNGSPVALDERHRQFLNMLANCEPINSVSKSSGVSERAIRAVLTSVKIALEANESSVDDYLELIENWRTDTGNGLMMVNDNDGQDSDHYLIANSNKAQDRSLSSKEKKQAIIDEIESEWSPYEMRDLGGSLIRLADAIDQDWSPGKVQSSFHWPSAAAQIERNSLELAKKATILKRQIGMRRQFLPEAMLGEPTWNMLLELFCQFAGGASVSTKALCIAADCPDSTALRYIEQLEVGDLVERSRSSSDRRVTMIKLTKKGVVGVGRVLERLTV